MPELAEVEFFRKQWSPALKLPVRGLRLHPQARPLRLLDLDQLERGLVGATLESSHAHGKQLLFRFSGDGWLGVHLGMSGQLYAAEPEIVPADHEHFVLLTDKVALVYDDYRQFGLLRWHQGTEPPAWWRDLPPDLISDGFTRADLRAFLTRRARAPIKSVLLLQERFPGIGNWMADEICWRARIKPHTPAGLIATNGRKMTDLFNAVKDVCADALRVIGDGTGGAYRRTMLKDPPDSWLFNHRWRDGGTCPQTGKPLERIEINGRTTCWSPAWQRWPRE